MSCNAARPRYEGENESHEAKGDNMGIVLQTFALHLPSMANDKSVIAVQISTITKNANNTENSISSKSFIALSARTDLTPTPRERSNYR
jgi:hypothetical protein